MSPAPTFVTIRGHTLYAPPLGPASVVMDLGANHGAFAHEASARFGGIYYLVEANPTCAEMLRADGRFPVWGVAVGGSDAPVVFHVAKNDEASSLFELPAESPWGICSDQAITVDGRTLESLIAEIGAPRIDVAKMDIEGAEVMALRSLSRQTLARIGQITVEFHGDPIFGFPIAGAVEDVIDSLEREGFLCLDFSNTRRFNVLCINLAIHPIPWYQRRLWSFRTTAPAWLRRAWRALPASWRRRVMV